MYVCALFVFIKLEFNKVNPLLDVNESKAFEPPTIPLNSVDAAPAIVKVFAPSTVASNFITEDGAEAVSVVFSESVTAPLYS